MKWAKESYEKYQKFIENILFPLVLILYPLLKINQGIDVSDTAYSLSNFQYFSQMNGTWIVATFLANAVGSLLMCLPLGDTLLGMNFYTSLMQSLTALAVYFVLRKKMPAPLVVLGEFMALGLCWCPSVILYNYLTYLLLTAGILLLYRGILEQRVNCRRWNLMAAGICLGINVAVRMPNVVQAALILAVWYGVWITGNKIEPARAVQEKRYKPLYHQMIQSTIWCMDGYLIGFGIPLVIICIRYGLSAYPAMVQTMFAMTEKAADYKPASMLTGMFGDYGRGLFWMLFAGICMFGGWLMSVIFHKLVKSVSKSESDTGRMSASAKSFGSIATLRVLGWICYVAVFMVLLRFYWGRGMFHFRYYEHDYGSVYYPAVLLLLVVLFAAAYCLVKKNVCQEQKVFAVLVILEIFLTPLGSNNALHPIINNLFLVVPFLLWVSYGLFRKSGGFVWKTPLLILLAFVLVQSIGFHMQFVFQDGIWGEKRDTLITTPAKAAGVYTNQDNGELLEELAVYVEDAGLSGREVILYGEVPGLGYLLDMPSALSTFWPDLDSYRMAEFERDMTMLKQRMEAGQEAPVIILASPVAAYLNEDADAINWFGVDWEKMDEDVKLRQLGAFMQEYAYVENFGNARYVVYVSGEE